MVVKSMRDGEELVQREPCYESVLILNAAKRFLMDELVIYLVKGSQSSRAHIKARYLMDVNSEKQLSTTNPL